MHDQIISALPLVQSNDLEGRLACQLTSVRSSLALNAVIGFISLGADPHSKTIISRATTGSVAARVLIADGLAPVNWVLVLL